MSRFVIVVMSLLTIGGLVAAYFAVSSPEVGLAWARVNDECGRSATVRDCLELLRAVNALRIRTWLVAFCFVFGGAVSALGCGVATSVLIASPQGATRQDGRRVNALSGIALVAVGGLLVACGLVVALRLP